MEYHKTNGKEERGKRERGGGKVGSIFEHGAFSSRQEDCEDTQGTKKEGCFENIRGKQRHQGG